MFKIKTLEVPPHKLEDIPEYSESKHGIWRDRIRNPSVIAHKSTAVKIAEWCQSNQPRSALSGDLPPDWVKEDIDKWLAKPRGKEILAMKVPWRISAKRYFHADLIDLIG